ncbi:MAG: MoxR family ATPase [Acidimicrobiales bacterium]|nr:MoxR family ATPase [Acidimicrobiales bacterium]
MTNQSGDGISSFAELRTRVKAEVSKVVIGQDHVIDAVLAAMCVGGHVLLEGPPGTAKTLLAATLSKSLGTTFKRIQFTPDMLPSDVTGTMTLRGGELVFRPGPVFANIVLADEINRTPPKTQASLLESMQEAQVTIDGEPRTLPSPFTVIATENPIEYEGTYPLPEAQLDRFLLKIQVLYPSALEELEVLKQGRLGLNPLAFENVSTVAGMNEIAQAKREVELVHSNEEIMRYVVNIVQATRNLPSISLGASTRAAVHLYMVAKAFASMSGRNYVTPDDVYSIAPSVLCHRLVMTPEAELDRFGPEDAIAAVLNSVPIPR